MCDPAVFLETAGLFTLLTPMELFLPSQQPLPEIPKLPALRAVVSAKGRARHLGFLLLSRRGVQNPSILTIFSVFPHLLQAAGFVHSAASPLSTEPAALGFGRIFVPHVGAMSGFGLPVGTPPGCAQKIGHSRDTRLTRVDRWFSAVPVGALPTAFGCVPAHTLRPALQAFAHKTAG